MAKTEAERITDNYKIAQDAYFNAKTRYEFYKEAYDNATSEKKAADLKYDMDEQKENMDYAAKSMKKLEKEAKQKGVSLKTSSSNEKAASDSGKQSVPPEKKTLREPQ